MRIMLMVLAGMIVSGVVASTISYNMTKTKWYGLGQQSGQIAGQNDVMAQLCSFAQEGKPPVKAAYYLDVKANRLSLVKVGDRIQLYCE